MLIIIINHFEYIFENPIKLVKVRMAKLGLYKHLDTTDPETISSILKEGLMDFLSEITGTRT